MSARSRSSERVSVVVVSRNEGARLRATVHELLATLAPRDEIVVVDDGSTDGSADALAHGYEGVRLLRPARRAGVAGARNLGAAAATGDVLVFADAHVRPDPGWRDAFLEALAGPGVGAVGPAMAVAGDESTRGYGLAWRDDVLNVEWLGRRDGGPYPVPLLGGAFLAFRRAVFDDVGGFDPGFVGWGGEDVELSARLWLLGYRCLVVPDVAVAHAFKDVLTHELPGDAVLHNLLRIAAVHFGGERLERTIRCLAADPRFPAALARLLDGDAVERRARLRSLRSRDDDWYFAEFRNEPLEVTS